MKLAPLWLPVLLAAMLPIGACTSEVKDVLATTQVTVRVSSDDSLRSVIDKVRLSLWVRQVPPANSPGVWPSSLDVGWRAGSSIEAAVSERDWPLVVPVLPKNRDEEDTDLEVIIEAYSKGVSVVRTRVETHFIPNTLAVVPAKLVPCPTQNLSCADDSCHGPECTQCNALGVCAPAGVSPRESLIDTLTDASTRTDAAVDGSDAGGASSTNKPDGAAPTNNDGRDSGVSNVEQTPDAAVAPVVDSGSAQPDAGTPDAGVTSACPAQNTCNALLYPCVATPAGYTCQGQLADWPMPDGVTGAKFAPSFTSTGQTAVDNVTKLEWQLGLPNTYPGCTSRKQLANGVQGPYAEWCTREEGIKYCADLVRGNHDDWRLPSMIELTSLFDMRDPPASANAIDLNFFGDSTSQDFISRSTGAGAPSKTWLVSYEFREIVVLNNVSGRVRCVRGGAAPSFATPADRYLVGADTVTDRATSLVWQRGFSPMPIDEGGAEAYCAALGVAFRVPTSNELMTLVDTTRPPPAIDTNAFPNTPSGAFALPSKTLVRESAVSFDTGMLQLSSSAPSYVRCVRNQ